MFDTIGQFIINAAEVLCGYPLFFLLIGGGLICVVLLLFLPEGGPGEVIRIANEYNKIDVGPYDWDLTQLTFIVMVLNGIFYALQKYGTDQTIVQRYLAAKNDR